MDITITELGPCRKRVAVDVPVDRVKQEFDKSYKELAHGVVLPGFRKGKVPRDLLRKRFGEKVNQQVKAILLHELFQKITDDPRIDPVAEPDLDMDSVALTEDVVFHYEVELEVKPDFDIGEYKGLEVQDVAMTVAPAQIDLAIERLRQQKSELAPVDGAEIADGDHLLCKVRVLQGDEVLVETERTPIVAREGKTLAGVGIPVGGLLGRKTGDQMSGELTLPADFAEADKRGQAARYEVTVDAHKRREIPDLDSDFFAEHDCASLDELKAKVRTQLEHELDHDREHVLIDALTDTLLARTTFELPATILEHETKRMRAQVEVELRNSGVERAQIEDRADQRMQELAPEIVQKIRRKFVLEKIGRLEKIEATDDEVEDRIRAMASGYGMWPNQMRQMLEERKLLEQVYSDVALHKIQHFLLGQAKILPLAGAPAKA